MRLAPIVLFLYNRPQHTRRAVEALKQNELAGKSKLYIFSDGPKTPADRESVELVRNYIKQVEGFEDISIIERHTNLGLAQSIITGVKEVIKEYGRVIVLEDDLITSKYFLLYMNEALDKYENEHRVMHISGYMYPVKEADKLPESFFYRETHSWGWATWKRAWDIFEQEPAPLMKKIKAGKLENEFDIRSPRFFSTMLKYQIAGYVDSWMIRWYASVFLQNGLCLYPAHSLVQNIGNDGSGTHTGRNRDYDICLEDHRVRHFPEIVEESGAALSAMMNFYRSLKRPLLKRIAWLWVRRIKKFSKIFRSIIRYVRPIAVESASGRK